MGKSVRALEITPELLKKITDNEPKCWLCWWIREDFEKNKKLTGHPYDYTDKAIFPVEAKINHMELEGFIGRLDASTSA